MALGDIGRERLETELFLWDRRTGGYVEAGGERGHVLGSAGNDRYIRRMPMAWVQRACKLPGQCGLVGMALWYRAGFSRGGPVEVSGHTRALFGLSSRMVAAALATLEGAGLIQCDRQPGKLPRVRMTGPGASGANGKAAKGRKHGPGSA